VKIAVLLSGTGRTLENFIKRTKDKTLFVEIALVIANRDAPGLQYAKYTGIPSQITSNSKEIFDLCREAHIDYVCLAGYLKFVQVPSDFENKVVNIHPSLLPAFGGKGMYGHSVHQAVWESGVKYTGCTIHFADNEYDHGPIIAQEIVPVLSTDTPDTIAHKVFQEETQLYPKVLNWLADGIVKVEGRKVILPFEYNAT